MAQKNDFNMMCNNTPSVEQSVRTVRGVDAAPVKKISTQVRHTRNGVNNQRLAVMRDRPS